MLWISTGSWSRIMETWKKLDLPTKYVAQDDKILCRLNWTIFDCIDELTNSGRVRPNSSACMCFDQSYAYNKKVFEQIGLTPKWLLPFFCKNSMATIQWMGEVCSGSFISRPPENYACVFLLSVRSRAPKMQSLPWARRAASRGGPHTLLLRGHRFQRWKSGEEERTNVSGGPSCLYVLTLHIFYRLFVFVSKNTLASPRCGSLFHSAADSTVRVGTCVATRKMQIELKRRNARKTIAFGRSTDRCPTRSTFCFAQPIPTSI